MPNAELQPLATKDSNYFCVELFCGSAGLTYAMKHFFKDSFGVDHVVGKAKSKVVCLNLGEKTNQELVRSWCTSSSCLWTHFGVPCGTASRARLRRMSNNHHGPPPLRSDRWPLGLPSLTGKNLAKVRAANILYRFTCDLILELDSLSKVWTLENPWNSLLWKTPYWNDVASRCNPYMVELDYCMFGGKRKKHAGLATNCAAAMELNVCCDGQHEHAPWGFESNRFATSMEAEYTPTFCKALASAVYSSLASDFLLPDADILTKKLKPSTFPQIAAQGQPSRSVPPIVSEFAVIISITCCNVPSLQCNAKHELSHCLIFQNDHQQLLIPAGSRLLRRAKSKRGEGAFCSHEFKIQPSQTLADVADMKGDLASILERQQYDFKLKCSCDKPCEYMVSFASDGEDLVFGVRWSPEAFVRQAIEAGHPFNLFSGLTSDMKNAIERSVQLRPAQVVLHRKKWLHHWLTRSKELEGNEKLLKADVVPERKRILNYKRILVLREILQHEQYTDLQLPDDIFNGFSLVGHVPVSNTLPKKFAPATMAVQELEDSAGRSREAIRRMTRSSGDTEVDQKLLEKTREEASKGWLVGPLDWSELGPTAVVSRRFPVQQGSKIRPIDDYSQSQINSTVSSTETASVDSVDTICAMFCYFMKMLQVKQPGCEILSRSLDLTSAYRQLTISESSRDFSYISIYCPEAQTALLYRQVALPFGSKAAVNAFIRCARCIQWLAVHCLLIPVTCYFDDFILACQPELSSNTEAAFTVLLDMLGWSFDRTGTKADAFSTTIAALGVIFDLAGTPSGSFKVCNTEKRLAEVLSMLAEISRKGSLTRKEAEVARGRLAFCDAYIFGRSGKSALQEITKHAYKRPFKESFGDDLRHALIRLHDRLELALPKIVSAGVFKCFYIFSDASFSSDGTGGLGAVLFDESHAVLAWFAFSTDRQSVLPFLQQGESTIIGELETLAVALALKLWYTILHSSHTVFFIDNEGSKFALIKGYSCSINITCVCDLVCDMLDENVIMPWYSRVPSSSNISDGPSRGLGHEWLSPFTKCPDNDVAVAFREIMSLVNALIQRRRPL